MKNLRKYIFENGEINVADGGYMTPEAIKAFEDEFGSLVSVRYRGMEVRCV